MIVNRFEIGDQLAKLPKIIENDFTSAIRRFFFSNTRFLQKRLQRPLDGVEAKTLDRIVEHLA